MVVTNEKLEANRANAQHATGPRTPAGKRVTCRNAATHNAFCQHLLLEGEDERRFRALRRPWLASLNPQNVAELFLADRAVSLMWRLDRLQAADQAAHDLRRADLLDKLHRLAAADPTAAAATDPRDVDPQDADRLARCRDRLTDAGLDPDTLVDPAFVLADAYAHPDADNPFDRLLKAEQRLHGMLNTTLRRLQSLQAHRLKHESAPAHPCPYLGPEDDDKEEETTDEPSAPTQELQNEPTATPSPSPSASAAPPRCPAPPEELRNEPKPTSSSSSSVPSVPSVSSPPPKLQNEPNPRAARILFRAVAKAAGDLLPPTRRTP